MDACKVGNNPQKILEDALKDFFDGLEKWCIIFNKFILTFFIYVKFIFVFILFFIGCLTLLKLRGIYLKIRTNQVKEDEDRLKKARLLLGWSYIFFALGILFNFFTYFLIWLLEPLPDRFFFQFINFHEGINPEILNRIEDINASKYPHEKTIYYCVAFWSFISLVSVFVSVFYIVNANRLITNPRATLGFLFGDLMSGMMAGFTTCLPFFL